MRLQPALPLLIDTSGFQRRWWLAFELLLSAHVVESCNFGSTITRIFVFSVRSDLIDRFASQIGQPGLNVAPRDYERNVFTVVSKRDLRFDACLPERAFSGHMVDDPKNQSRSVSPVSYSFHVRPSTPGAAHPPLHCPD